MIFSFPFQDVFNLTVEVTHYHLQPADPTADSDNDYFGYLELEWHISSGTIWCPDKETDLPVEEWQLQGLQRNPLTSSAIESIILDQMRIARDSELEDLAD